MDMREHSTNSVNFEDDFLKDYSPKERGETNVSLSNSDYSKRRSHSIETLE
jgi:hypothetical protein